jgi:CheY-like chemotaxis protein
MRPKKKILLYCRDAKQTSVLCFLLRNWGYAVTAVSRIGAALELLEAGDWFHGVLLFADASDVKHATFAVCATEIEKLQGKRGDALRLCVSGAETPVSFLPTIFRLDVQCHLWLREGVRLMVGRKRGPRKRMDLLEKAA